MSTGLRLLAAGRDCDIFEYRPGLVLRRSRRGHSLAYEARVIEHVRAAGYPVPAVESVSDDGLELVMERIDGVSMAEVMMRRPWLLGAQARVLADLHQRLHRIDAPEWVRPSPVAASTATLVHLDLHPLNVMISQRGPVVIDWPNTARGDGSVDVALAWVLMACAGIPASPVKARLLGLARGTLVRAFLSHFPVSEVRRLLPAVVEWKCGDANMTPAEVAAMRRLAGSA